MICRVALSASLLAIVLAGCAAPASSSSSSSSSSSGPAGEPQPEALAAAQIAQMRMPASAQAPFELPLACEEPGRYVVRGDVVIDTANDGRIWQRAVDPVLRSQTDASLYCASVTVDGLAGWRLPDVHELQSLRLRPSGLSGGPQYCMPSIDQSAFPETPADEFWSATTRPAGDGLYTGFDDGRTHPSDPTTPMHARCVHDAIRLN